MMNAAIWAMNRTKRASACQATEMCTDVSGVAWSKSLKNPSKDKIHGDALLLLLSRRHHVLSVGYRPWQNNRPAIAQPSQ